MIIKSSREQFQAMQGEVYSFRLQENQVLQCRSGKLWITRKDDLHDYWLSEGQSLRFPNANDLMIEADQHSIYFIQTPPLATSRIRKFDALNLASKLACFFNLMAQLKI